MKLSRNIAVSCVNADPSGLNEEDLEVYNSIGDFTVLDWAEESTDINGKCDFTGYWDHCVEIELKD